MTNEQDIVPRLRRNAGFRNEQWHCITDPALLTAAAATIEALREELAGRDAEIARAIECLLYSAGTTTDPHTARQIVAVYTRLGSQEAK